MSASQAGRRSAMTTVEPSGWEQAPLPRTGGAPSALAPSHNKRGPKSTSASFLDLVGPCYTARPASPVHALSDMRGPVNAWVGYQPVSDRSHLDWREPCQSRSAAQF